MRFAQVHDRIVVTAARGEYRAIQIRVAYTRSGRGCATAAKAMGL
jgi:hypothetical protein